MQSRLDLHIWFREIILLLKCLKDREIARCILLRYLDVKVSRVGMCLTLESRGWELGVLLGARARANCPTWHEVPASHWSLVSRDLDTGLWLVGSPEPGRDFLRLCLTRNRAMFGWKQGRKQAFWANNKDIKEIFGTMFRFEVKKFGKTYFSLHLHFFAKYFGVDGSGAGARGWAGGRWSRIPLPTSSPWSQNWRDGWIMFPSSESQRHTFVSRERCQQQCKEELLN